VSKSRRQSASINRGFRRTLAENGEHGLSFIGFELDLNSVGAWIGLFRLTVNRGSVEDAENERTANVASNRDADMKPPPIGRGLR